MKQNSVILYSTKADDEKVVFGIIVLYQSMATVTLVIITWNEVQEHWPLLYEGINMLLHSMEG